ncbi:amino acid ABC transporter permease [Xylophilus sp. GW821-FHT01B05]
MRFVLDFAAVLAQWPLLLSGLVWTCWLTLLTLTLGLVLGAACAWARSSGPQALAAAVGIYVELVRNTPFIVQLFFVFFGLPALGVKLSPATASTIALVLNLGAYATEIIRAGIEATPRGQVEAAQSLALGPVQIFLRVVLPPALARVWPALTGQVIIVMLGSAVCSAISTEELSYAANLIQSRNFRAFESYALVAVLYLLLAMGLRRLLDWAGPRFIFAR